jgi:hypothetical protein
MGPQSEGRPSGDGRAYGMSSGRDDGRYQQSRDLDPNMQPQQQNWPNPAFASENRSPASPSISLNGREREGDPRKLSTERERSRTRSNRKGSGQLRICKKCGEPLTGQFVRALGGTFHLDCFKCRVSSDLEMLAS